MRSGILWNCTEASPVPHFCILLQISEDPVTKIVQIIVGQAGFKVYVLWTNNIYGHFTLYLYCYHSDDARELVEACYLQE